MVYTFFVFFYDRLLSVFLNLSRTPTCYGKKQTNKKTTARSTSTSTAFLRVVVVIISFICLLVDFHSITRFQLVIVAAECTIPWGTDFHVYLYYIRTFITSSEFTSPRQSCLYMTFVEFLTSIIDVHLCLRIVYLNVEFLPRFLFISNISNVYLSIYFV